MLFERFRALADVLPAGSGLRQRGEVIPYGELADRAGRLAAGLMERDIGPGVPVVLLVPNSPNLFVAAYALFAIGAIAVPLSVGATAQELANSARKAGAAAIIVEDAHEGAAEGLVAALGRPLSSIRTSEFAGLSTRSVPLAAPPAEATAIHLFSSGSTGRPKVVPHTHAEMLAEGEAAGRHGVGLTPADTVLNSLPGHHGFGFMTVHFEAVMAGATTVFWSDPRPFLISRGRFLGALAGEGVTVLPAVPFALEALCGLSDEVDLGRLRLVYTGGVGLRRALYDRFFARFGRRIGQGYGATEFGQITFSDGTDTDAWDSVGRVTPGTQVRITEGELMVRSRQLTRGYLGADAGSNAAFRDGWFTTGDLARRDADGRLYIAGRRKLIIEVSGMKVDPVEVEDVFLSHPAVAEAVVVGVPDTRGGEQALKLVAVLKDEVRPDALLRFGRERLSAYKAPALVEIRSELPRSATGKILRGRLVEEA